MCRKPVSPRANLNLTVPKTSEPDLACNQNLVCPRLSLSSCPHPPLLPSAYASSPLDIAQLLALVHSCVLPSHWPRTFIDKASPAQRRAQAPVHLDLKGLKRDLLAVDADVPAIFVLAASARDADGLHDLCDPRLGRSCRRVVAARSSSPPPKLGHDPIGTDLLEVDVVHVEKGALLHGQQTADGLDTADESVDGEEVEEAIVGQRSGEERRRLRHDGHVAAVEVAERWVGGEWCPAR